MTRSKTWTRPAIGLAATAVMLTALACGGSDADEATQEPAGASSSATVSPSPATTAPGATGTPAAPRGSATATATNTSPVASTPTASGSASPTASPTPGGSRTPTPGAATPATGTPAPATQTVVTPGAPVRSLYLETARLGSSSPVEVRDTIVNSDGREQFQDPSSPGSIAWYPRFGRPGMGGTNSIFAAHINYVNYGNGPFAYLTSVSAGDALYVKLDGGTELTYTVRSVDVVPLSSLDMDEVVYPSLNAGVERITLISCGGTFVPNASGTGGDYDSRVILVAERVI